MERTFVMVKPDGYRRRLVGEVIARLERRGLDLVAARVLRPDRALGEAHYAVHRDKPFFSGLVDFITSGPVVAMVWEGPGAIAAVRQTVGATRPLEAAPGTLRADFCLEVQENLVHASDGPETAASEIALWFPELAEGD